MLNNHSRSWIYNKIQGHYRRELYFQGLDISFYFSVFKFCLSKSNDFQELEFYLKKYNINDCLNFTRKTTKDNNSLKFSYPSLSFQAESLFHCWNEILEIQKNSKEDISKAINYQQTLKFMKDEDEVENEDEMEEALLDTSRFCYGNKPNWEVSLNSNSDKNVQREEERKVFPIATDFKYEYNSFRRSVIVKSKNIIEKDKKNIIFIQTDIKTFFHNLEVEPLAVFIKEKFPKAKNLYKYLRLLRTQFNYDTLPIGWILSRFVANIITQEFHLLFKKYLSKNFQNSLEKKQFSISEGNKVDLSKKWPVILKHQISYVDDFVFLMSIPADSKGVPEKTIADLLLKEANNLLNKVLKENKPLEFHKLDSEKTKYHLFNKDNISTLKTNFSFFDTADDYLIGDSELTARVDEILLPVDNDITLNANQQFHRNLKSLQKIVIGNRHFREEDVNDLLGQIQIKIEKTGARYIRSVFRLFYLLELSELSNNIKEQIKTTEIKNIFNKFKKNSNHSFEWVKFFNGYFHFLKSIEYQNTDQFFELLNKAFQSMKYPTEDDKMLFTLLKNEYIYKIILNTSGKQKPITKISESKINTLSVLSNQRKRAINFLSKVICNQNKSTNKLSISKSEDLTWISIVLNQLLVRNYNIKATQIFQMIETFQKKNTETLHFGLSRIATVYLPFNTQHNQSQFIKKVKQYKNKPFWQIAHKLISCQKHLVNYYKLNEKKRLEHILQNLKTNNFLKTHITAKTDIIWFFIVKSFSTEQNKICAYFIANRLNNESEFMKYILTAHLKIESSQLTPWSVIPLTLQKTGIHTSQIIKKLFEVKYNEQKKLPNIVKDTNIVNFLENAIDKTKIQKLDKFINQKNFGVNIVDLDLLSTEFEDQKFKDKPFKITIAPLQLNLEEDLDFSNNFKFKREKEKLIDSIIRGAIDEAVRQEASILIFPELSIPRNYLGSYLKLASEHGIALIGGLEYFTEIRKNAYNSTIVSIPVNRSLNPGGREYFTFEQIKNFPASEENYYLTKHDFKYQHGSGVFIFKSDFWGDFAVLTCSDFLSLGLRWILQGEVQTVFVPAQNKDSLTYDHISETSIRDLHCLTIVCNNPERGGSHCYAPYYDHKKRQLFKKIGTSKPEYHTFQIEKPKQFKETQQKADPVKPFRNLENKKNTKDYPYSEYKQLPPDWNFWK